ncbi:Caudovirus, tape measure, N-terminal [Moorella glycerini]|uniref:Tape measure protein N-terminal domain-containing protein n=1 Tax=Neomoorella stamsii TaxID=1266720 RepID=A0A9X7J016_9FIRM|nr:MULTISPECIES: tape measure protein [Moorella]PRR69590.1 hypothetical protein MOST_30120 [Moorella stamsii]CEP67886.1 Caudovirus, tape measure, N-terminal [Moorella glycerini]CEP68756.1 Caudovirus, tape measure, N-terminal [Moorella glycerini]
MAESEVYRIEIPIIVHDQTEAPLRQAQERVNKFQRSAERTNQRLRQMAAREYRLRLSVLDRAMPIIEKVGRGLRGITSRAWNITLGIKDTAFGAIRRLTGILTSPLGLLGIGVGGAAITAGLVKAPLELAGNMEQARIGFTTMLGSAEKATAFLKELQLFAAKTPFEFPQLQESSRLLLAFGFAAQDVVPMMTAIGNAAAGLGVGAEGIDRAVRALGQMRAKGKVSAEEIMQLTEIGIPAYDILQKKFGLSAKQMENLGKAGITADAAIKALVEGMNERFKDMMRNQSVSLLGLWSTIKDTFSMQILYRWGEGLRQAIQPKVLRLVEWFEQNQATVERWGNTLERTAREAGEALIRNVERAFGYIRRRYLDNPEFQRLDFWGKVKFVWDDIMDSIQKWLDSGGQEQLNSIGTSIGEFIAAGVEAAAPRFGTAMITVGKTMAITLIKSFEETLRKSPIGAFIAGGLSGAAMGSVIPGVGAGVGFVAGGFSALGSHLITSIIEQKTIEGNTRAQLEAFRTIESHTGSGPVFGGQSIGARAFGGIVNYPVIAGEAGPEAIIPLSGQYRNRGINLWERTGKYLGIQSSGSANITNNVTVIVNGSTGGDASAEEIADAVADAIAQKIEACFFNRP